MQDSVRVLERTYAILSALERAGRPLSVQELSDMTQIPKSTVHRLLSSMLKQDFIEQQQEDGRYRLGLRFLELGYSAATSRSIINIANPFMQRISYELQESVCLALMKNGEVLIIHFCESPKNFNVVSRVGSRLPAHCTVQGKIMLAYMKPNEVKQILDRHGMRIYTPSTIHTYEELKPELESIREQGYAIERSEFKKDLFSVAAPIFDATGKVLYSFAIVSMPHKIGSPVFERAKEYAVEAAKDITHDLGYR